MPTPNEEEKNIATDDGIPIQFMKHPRNTLLGASIFLESIGMETTDENILQFVAKEFQEAIDSAYLKGIKDAEGAIKNELNPELYDEFNSRDEAMQKGIMLGWNDHRSQTLKGLEAIRENYEKKDTSTT